MAYSMDTAELQRISQEMLELYIYDPKTLREDCPLDHGRHNLNDVKHDLGTLMKLPLEIRYTVLDKIDVQSLLVFRRASKAAMTTVNNMVSYQKVIASAPDCMAIAIETSHTFSLVQLVSKLAQTHCDGIDCTNLAPYLDVFTLTRRCLSIGGGCPSSRAPLTVGHLESAREFKNIDVDARMTGKQKFAALAGRYDDQWRIHGKPVDEDEDELNTYFYAYEDIKQEFFSDKTRRFFQHYEQGGGAELAWFWKLCSVVAPWLKAQVGEVETGVFCDMCECVERYVPIDLDYHDGPGWPPSIRWMIEGRWYVVEEHPEIVWPDPMSVPFMSVQNLEEHRKNGHSVNPGLERDLETYDWNAA